MMFWITLFPLTNLLQCTSWMSDLEWLQRLLALCTTQCSQRNMDRITCTAEACIICDMSQKHKITEMYKISFTTFDCLCDFFLYIARTFPVYEYLKIFQSSISSMFVSMLHLRYSLPIILIITQSTGSDWLHDNERPLPMLVCWHKAQSSSAE